MSALQALTPGGSGPPVGGSPAKAAGPGGDAPVRPRGAASAGDDADLAVLLSAAAVAALAQAPGLGDHAVALGYADRLARLLGARVPPLPPGGLPPALLDEAPLHTDEASGSILRLLHALSASPSAGEALARASPPLVPTLVAAMRWGTAASVLGLETLKRCLGAANPSRDVLVGACLAAALPQLLLQRLDWRRMGTPAASAGASGSGAEQEQEEERDEAVQRVLFVDILNLLTLEGAHAARARELLDASDVWSAYRGQRHDLFLPAGGAHAAGVAGLLTGSQAARFALPAPAAIAAKDGGAAAAAAQPPHVAEAPVPPHSMASLQLPAAAEMLQSAVPAAAEQEQPPAPAVAAEEAPLAAAEPPPPAGSTPSTRSSLRAEPPPSPQLQQPLRPVVEPVIACEQLMSPAAAMDQPSDAVQSNLVEAAVPQPVLPKQQTAAADVPAADTLGGGAMPLYAAPALEAAVTAAAAATPTSAPKDPLSPQRPATAAPEPTSAPVYLAGPLSPSRPAVPPVVLRQSLPPASAPPPAAAPPTAAQHSSAGHTLAAPSSSPSQQAARPSSVGYEPLIASPLHATAVADSDEEAGSRGSKDYGPLGPLG